MAKKNEGQAESASLKNSTRPESSGPITAEPIPDSFLDSVKLRNNDRSFEAEVIAMPSRLPMLKR